MLGDLAGIGVGPFGVVCVDGELSKVLQSWVRAAVTAKLALLCLFGQMWHQRAQATSRAGGTSGQAQWLETCLCCHTLAPSQASPRPSERAGTPHMVTGVL